eukprot:1037965-Rhodomonas_salina.1
MATWPEALVEEPALGATGLHGWFVATISERLKWGSSVPMLLQKESKLSRRSAREAQAATPARRRGTGRAPLARVEAEAAAAYPPAGTRVCKERQGILPWLGTRVPNLVGGPPTGQTALHFGALPGALEPSHANTTT